MASVFKKTFTKPLPDGAEIMNRKGEHTARWKDRTGKFRSGKVLVAADGRLRVLIEASTFTAKFRDGSGSVVEVATGCRSKDGAMAVLKDLTDRAEKVRSGVLSSAEDSTIDHQQTPIAVHIEAYIAHLEARGTTKGHRDDRKRYLDKLADDCGFRRLRDLDRTVLERWLGVQAAAKKSARLRNAYRTSALAFANWCIDAKRIIHNPFDGTPVANEKADPRRRRRALTEKELVALLQATQMRAVEERMKVRRGVDKDKLACKLKPKTRERLERLGRERALIYKTLVLTGLRKGELASLTIGQLHLEDPTPHANLLAADEKNRQGSKIALRGDLVMDLKQWLGEQLRVAREAASDRGEPIPVRLPSNTRLFKIPSKLSKVLEMDLERAKVPKVDERGRVVDVHALRHTFGTHLSKGGVPLRTAQAAMRHSTPLLTANVYTDPALLDVGAALNALPKLPLVSSQSTVKHVAGADYPSRTLAPTLAPTHGKTCQSASWDGKLDAEQVDDDLQNAHAETPVNRGDCHRVSRPDTEVEWWAVQDSNLRPPACKAGALTS